MSGYLAGPNDSGYRRAGGPDEAILEMKDLGEKVFYGG